MSDKDMEKEIQKLIDDGMSREEAELKCKKKKKKVEFKLETAELHNVEIAEQGTFKGVKVDEKLFDKFIDSFNNKSFPAVITIDHDIKATEAMKKALDSQNLGKVSKLWKNGKKLMANFKQVPQKLAELIKSGRLIERSIEFAKNFKIANGDRLDAVLGGVTFHGGANGTSAILTLSDEFDLIETKLKSIEPDSDRVQYNNVNWTTILKQEDSNMPTIEVEKKEYDQLVILKDDYADLKNQNSELTNQITELKTSNDDLSKVKDEFDKFKADVEEKEVEALKAEAESFVDGVVKELKLESKYRDMEVENYIRYKNESDEKLKLFKERLENAPEVVDSGEILKDDSGNEIKTTNFKDTDEAEKYIQHIMKRDSLDYEHAAVKAGLFTAEEMGIEKEVK